MRSRTAARSPSISWRALAAVVGFLTYTIGDNEVENRGGELEVIDVEQVGDLAQFAAGKVDNTAMTLDRVQPR